MISKTHLFEFCLCLLIIKKNQLRWLAGLGKTTFMKNVKTVQNPANFCVVDHKK